MNTNKKRATMRSKAHKNYMGGPSYDLSPFAKLYIVASSCYYGESAYYDDVQKGTFKAIDEDSYRYDTIRYNWEHLEKEFGNMSGLNRMTSLETIIKDALEYNPELTIRFFDWLRNEGNIRTTPQVGMAIAFKEKKVTGDGTRTFTRLDDVLSCLAYYIEKYTKNGMSSKMKRSIAKRIERASEYEMAKYRSENKAVSLKDAVRISHAHNDIIDKLMKDELKQTADNTTWEAYISTNGSTKENWEYVIPKMGHMALLRNLRNFDKFEINPDLYLDKLIAGVEKGRQMPYRYYSAYCEVTDARVKDALNKCMRIAVKNLPVFKGKSLILVDNSGSARGARISDKSRRCVCDVGNLMGVLTGIVSGSGKVGVFGDRISYLPVNSACDDIMGTTKTVDELGHHVGSATENGIWLALDDAIKSREKFDRIFIYSDMQAGHGGLYGFDNAGYPIYPGKSRYSEYIDVPRLVNMYRSKVNPDCKLYSIQIGGYGDSIFPEFYPNTAILGGWSDSVLEFAAMFEQDPRNVEEIFKQKFGL